MVRAPWRVPAESRSARQRGPIEFVSEFRMEAARPLRGQSRLYTLFERLLALAANVGAKPGRSFITSI